MYYLEKVRDAIEYIETNINHDIKTSDIAREMAFSIYHFHRIFLAVAGQTLGSYIRRRRLTEAAYDLQGTTRKIIDIAFDYQFETPESFIRAFKRMFGVTPGQYRKRKSHFFALHQNRIDQALINNLSERVIPDPKIIIKYEFYVAGIPYHGENRNNEISQIWDRFILRINEIDNQVNSEISFGICYPVTGQTENSDFDYLAGIEVEDTEEVPEGMIVRILPRQKYAVFTHKGPVNEIKETYEYIYGIWQPRACYDLVYAPDFEYYDERFDPDHQEESELDIYIPIK